MHEGHEIRKGSTITVPGPGNKGVVERLYETSNPELLYKNRVKARNTQTGMVYEGALGKEENPSFGKLVTPLKAKPKNRRLGIKKVR